MPIATLSQASCMNTGADLWVLPPLRQSKAAQKLDWYLNFQFSRSSLHQSAEIQSPMKKLLEKTGLPLQFWSKSDKKDSTQLLISSSKLLPNRWAVQIENPDDLESWCKAISQVWSGLNSPSLRVFLPTGLSAGDFQKVWKQTQSFDDFTIVLD